jgi:hypothetical protein
MPAAGVAAQGRRPGAATYFTPVLKSGASAPRLGACAPRRSAAVPPLSVTRYLAKSRFQARVQPTLT